MCFNDRIKRYVNDRGRDEVDWAMWVESVGRRRGWGSSERRNVDGRAKNSQRGGMDFEMGEFA